MRAARPLIKQASRLHPNMLKKVSQIHHFFVNLADFFLLIF